MVGPSRRDVPLRAASVGRRGDPKSGTHPRLGSDDDSVGASRRRVIIAEDDDSERQLLATSLRAAGFDVTAVADGKELLELLERVPRGWFSVAVVDHRMPRMFGLEVLARASSRARFVMVSGATDGVLRGAATSLGAEAFLLKPFDFGELIAIVRHIVGDDPPPA